MNNRKEETNIELKRLKTINLKHLKYLRKWTLEVQPYNLQGLRDIEKELHKMCDHFRSKELYDSIERDVSISEGDHGGSTSPIKNSSPEKKKDQPPIHKWFTIHRDISK